jgi:hypothetical protein
MEQVIPEEKIMEELIKFVETLKVGSRERKRYQKKKNYDLTKLYKLVKSVRHGHYQNIDLKEIENVPGMRLWFDEFRHFYKMAFKAEVLKLMLEDHDKKTSTWTVDGYHRATLPLPLNIRKALVEECKVVAGNVEEDVFSTQNQVHSFVSQGTSWKASSGVGTENKRWLSQILLDPLEFIGISADDVKVYTMYCL